MLFTGNHILYLLHLLLLLLVAYLQAPTPVLAAFNNVSTTTTSTTEKPIDFNETLPDTHGRSMLSDLPRQGRILNDDNISIKGFIPIMGLGEDTAKDSKPSKSNKSPTIDQHYFDKLLKEMAAKDNNNKMNMANLPQHVAQPEDQRYIGAALQGLLGNAGSIRKSAFGLRPNVNRKSDCVCVPFYLCKNGYTTEGSSSSELSQMYPMYNQRRNEQVEPQSDSLQINERSNDNLNETQFTEEILSQMLTGKSMSDGCGLLRTCCQRASVSQISSANLAPAFSPELAAVYPEAGPGSSLYQQMQPSYPPPYTPYKPQQQYHKHSNYHNPTIRPPYPPTHQHHTRPSKLINSASLYEPMYEAPLPVPIRNDAYGVNVANFAYDKCGARQSVGINGRVQNLNYHQSSTEFGEFPWQVAILKKIGPSDNLYVCGGALISSGFVLTAAHCIKKFQANDIKIRLGEWDVHREDEFYPYIEKNVHEIIIHPHFSPRNLANDAVILRLDSEIDFNEQPHISPICLADTMDSFTGHRCYVSGWGKNSFGHQGEYQSVLMKVDLPVLDGRLCENLLRRTRLGYNFRLDRSMICAGGEPNKDACEGDGGSGLVCEVDGTWKVAGLVSWGLGCGKAAVPGVYTNIAHLRNWIDQVIFPYYANQLAAKSSEKNFNELISERSLDGSQNSTIIAAPVNSTSS